MTGIPRMPRDIDPRQPHGHNEGDDRAARKPARSYGQSAEVPDRDEIEDFEDLTDEPVREGNDTPSEGSGAARNREKRELREFEELAGEPVLDENKEKPK